MSTTNGGDVGVGRATNPARHPVEKRGPARCVYSARNLGLMQFRQFSGAMTCATGFRLSPEWRKRGGATLRTTPAHALGYFNDEAPDQVRGGATSFFVIARSACDEAIQFCL